jgi:hypothetical protein
MTSFGETKMPFRFRFVPALALASAVLAGSRSPADIVITEIHYDPVDEMGVSQPSLEFVEVFNDGSEPYDLSGYRFTRGFAFVIPRPTILGAQSYLAVCRDVAAATSHYGLSNAVGGFTQALDNAGETIDLSNPQGAVVSSVSYNDRGRWPAGANGTGHSLSIRNPYSDPSDPDSWTLSAQMDGTPGAANFGGPAPETVPVFINEGYLRDGGSGTRFVEIYNASEDAIDLAGYWLTDDFVVLKKYALPGGTSVPGRSVLAFTEAETGLDFAFAPLTRERISVALTNPAGTRVVDAVTFEPSADGKSEARVPDGDRVLQPAAEPTQGAPNATLASTGVIINEIMYHPLSGSELEEFIEIHNRGESEVDLASWRVDGVGLTFPPDTSIAAGAYLVIARDPVLIQDIYGLSSDAVHSTPWLGSLRDGGERVDLIDASGNLVDAVSYKDGGEWPHWADGGGSSLELIDPASDNSAGGSWDASDDAAKAEMAAITYGPVPFGGGESDFGIMLADTGIAIVDDISLVRTGTATNLIQNGTFESSTVPWRIEGTHIRSGLTAKDSERLTGAGSLKLVCWNGGGDYKVNRIEQDTAAQSSGTYTVSFNARWVVGSPRIITIGDYNVSQPSNPGLAGSNAIPVPRALGTPGAANSVTLRQVAGTGSSNVGPAIDRVSHAPGVPQASEQVTVSARVRDPDGVSSVSLSYRTETPIGAFTQVSMDDPDGDGIYTAVIPGQALNVRVLYFVEATDGSGSASRFPTDQFQRTHPPIVDPAAAQPNHRLYCMYRHDIRNVVTNDHSYRFVLNQATQDYLLSRRVHSNEMVDGTFVFGPGDVYYNSQIRFAGSPFLRRGGTFNNSYAVKMPRGNALHQRKRAFNLDQHGNDGRERISHYLLRQSAAHTTVPYHDFQTLVRFQMNGALTATYEALDRPNGDYISFWFPDADQGPFFEVDDRFGFNDGGNRTGNADARVQHPPYGTTGGDNKENYRWFFGVRSNENADDFTSLQELCRIMDEGVTSNAQFDVEIWNHLDVEEVLRVWAVEMNIDDWDTWAGRRGKNCYLYQSTADGLWRLIPWDLELTYGNVNAFALPSTPTGTYGNFFAEIQRMINRPRMKRMYYGILAEQVKASTGFFHSGFLNAYMQQLAGAGVSRTNVGTAGGWIDSRANLIRGWIQTSTYPQVRLTITTRGGASFATSAAAVDLEGTAPADVFFLRVFRNGESLDPAPEFAFSTANMTGWTLSAIPIGPGVNTIEVLGLGSQGGVVDVDSIQIASSADWSPPAITEVYPTGARAGETITILGSDFHAWLKVYFGAVEATNVTFDEAGDPGRISVVVPAGAAVGETTVMVRNADDAESNAAGFTVVPPPPPFIRGDGNLDGVVDLSDALKVLFHLFSGLAVPCRDALDADDSGSIDITDAMYVLDHAIREGPAPAQPYPASGADPTEDDGLDCEQGLP